MKKTDLELVCEALELDVSTTVENQVAGVSWDMAVRLVHQRNEAREELEKLTALTSEPCGCEELQANVEALTEQIEFMRRTLASAADTIDTLSKALTLASAIGTVENKDA